MKMFKSLLIALSLLITGCGKSTPNLANPGEEQPTNIYLLYNGARYPTYMFHKTKYKDTNQDTYVLGFYSFNMGDTISVRDENKKKSYSYDALYEKGMMNYDDKFIPGDGKIIIHTSLKVGIEFSRNGDEKIRFHFIDETADFYPLSTHTEYINAHVTVNNGEPIQMTNINHYTKDSDTYKEYTWFINNKYIDNKDGVYYALSREEEMETLSITLRNLEYNSTFEIAINDFECSQNTSYVLLYDFVYESDTCIRFQNQGFYNSNDVKIEFFPIMGLFEIAYA